MDHILFCKLFGVYTAFGIQLLKNNAYVSFIVLCIIQCRAIQWISTMFLFLCPLSFFYSSHQPLFLFNYILQYCID